MAKTPAQFLVESLVADVLLLGEWGAQEPLLGPELQGSEANEVPAEEPLSKAELRRKRNRERTKQARETHQQNVERMKVTVQMLTQQLDLLLRTQRADQDNGATSEYAKRYAALTETEHRLKAEKLLLRSSLVRHQNMHQRLVDVFATDKDGIAAIQPEAPGPNLAISQPPSQSSTPSRSNEQTRPLIPATTASWSARPVRARWLRGPRTA